MHRHGENAVPNLDDQVVMRPHQAVLHARPAWTTGRSRKVTEQLEPVDVVPVEAWRDPDTVGVDVEDAGSDVTRLVRHAVMLA